jgi:SAM-dependent methyltransferase
LPFTDASFDMVVCQFGLMFFPDKDKSFREVHRVLVSGGVYLFNVWDSLRYNAFARVAHETAGAFFPVDPPQFYEVPFSCHAIDPVKQALLDAGFDAIEIAVVGFQKSVQDSAAFARALVYGNPLIEQIRTRGGVDPERVVETLTGRLRREFGDDPGTMPLQANVFSARRQ